MPEGSKKGGGLKTVMYKMKGSPHKLGTIEGTSAFKKHTQEHEGNETMGGEQLQTKWGIEGLKGNADYYINRGKQGEPMILGEVGLEKGNVTGVPGSKGGRLTRKGD